MSGKKSWFEALALSLTLSCVGCERAPSATEGTSAVHEAVESNQRGAYYDVAFTPAPSLAALAAAAPEQNAGERAKVFVRELAMQGAPYWATGSMTVPALTAVGGSVVMAPPPATSRIRYSCGITLISPSYAITAGHCPTADTKVDELKLQLYRPTPKLVDTWAKSEALSGSWPELHHPRLDASDGYLLDEYSCTLLTRCYSANVACNNNGSDVALLKCDGRPGDKYGFLNVSTASAAGKEALMHWKHEVLDLGPEPIPADYVDHYVRYPATTGDNFHYFESENQLLPLRSILWPGAASPTFLSDASADVYGCHGTSGSGVLARESDSAEYRLVGPVALGGKSFGGDLCEHVPSTNGNVSGPGIAGLSVNFGAPQLLLDQYATELAGDCRARKVAERDVAGLPFAPGSHRPATLFSYLSCQVDPFAHGGSVAADPSFGPYPEKFIDDTDAAEHVIQGFEVEADADYRLAFEAQSLGACPACARPQLRFGAQTTSPDVKLTNGRTLLTHTFAASGAGPLQVGVENGGSKLAIGGFTLLREGQVNSFDVLEDRLEATLYSLDADGKLLVGPAPMRFVGDGSAAFQARLLSGERMALLRQALGPAHRWTVRLGAPSFEGMTCGLLDLNGAPLLGTPCKAVLSLDDRDGTDARLGFFVELPLGSERPIADIAYVALASEQARDPDGDGVPDVVDNCPGDWNAAQGDCGEEPPVVVGSGGEGGVSDGGAGGMPDELAGGAGVTSSAGQTSGGVTSVAGAAGVAGTLMRGDAGTATSSGGETVTPKGDNSDASGCGCAVPGGGEHRGSAAACFGLALAAVLARRRRQSRVARA